MVPVRLAADPQGALQEVAVSSIAGLRMRQALEEEPEAFPEAFEAEVKKLQSLSGGPSAERSQVTSATSPSRHPEADAWYSRMDRVLRGERAQAASELMHLKVFHRFAELGIEPLTKLVGGGGRPLPHLDPKALVRGLYSKDALELVAAHVRRLIGQWDHLVRDFPLRVSTFQAGQVYTLSALFGYYLRRADARFQLDRLAGNVQEEPRALAKYAADFGLDRAWGAAAVGSLEAEEALERQVTALFGDLAQLQEELADALGLAAGPEAELQRRLKDAVAAGEVASLRLTVGDLRRLALEGCAFGHLLGEAEADMDAATALTPAERRSPVALLGGEAVNVPNFATFRIFET